MTEPGKPVRGMIEQQRKELDTIFKQAAEDLNTVAGAERVAKWKARTVALIAQQVGPQEAKRFAETRPGPSFTSDLLEELGDEIEVYRTFLVALAEQVKKAG